MKHYKCQNIVAKGTRATRVSDTLEFRHHHLTIPTRTPADYIIHGVKRLTTAINAAPAVECDNQLAAIQSLRQAFHWWLRPQEQPPPGAPDHQHPSQTIHLTKVVAHTTISSSTSKGGTQYKSGRILYPYTSSKGGHGGRRH